MTAQTVPTRTTVRSAADPVAAAREYVESRALRADGRGRVGLELEFHLVDLAQPARRPEWVEVERLAAELSALPGRSRVTVEPGGQLELSTDPRPDVEAAVRTLTADIAAMKETLAPMGYGAAALGADPARPLGRVNPNPRYAAMERHFAARGYARSGAAMMTATAALQVNLDAGTPEAWTSRMALLRVLTPLFAAISANSPWLAGASSGWRSMREQSWLGVDRRRSDPIPAGPPTAAWADYALEAPVMLVRTADRFRAVTERIRLREWLADPRSVGRPAEEADVDYHLTTLFPPVRPRGYVELRCLDALPAQWWPAMVGLVVTLVDDPRAADLALDACAGSPTDLTVAARFGLADPRLRRAAVACAEVAVARCPDGLRPELERLAELIARGRTPGDDVRDRIAAVGPLRTLEEAAHA
jgi:glutamate--cysteine ligase